MVNSMQHAAGTLYYKQAIGADLAQKRTRVGAFREALKKMSTNNDVANVLSCLDTPNFLSEHMQRTARIYSELTLKYSELLQTAQQATPPDQEAIKAAQAKVDALARMRLVEYSANSRPGDIKNQGGIKTQDDWDALRANFTHDKNDLPTHLPVIEYTNANGQRQPLCLLTVCAPDEGTPENKSDTIYTQNHDGITYASYGWVVANKSGVVPSKDDLTAF
jgi:hypothetical protein